MVIQCNSTLAELYVEEEPLWPEHSQLTFHGLGLGLSIIFGFISVLIAFYLIFRHATHYLVPSQQKHIIRILLMIPVYSAVSFLSFLYYRHAVYYQVLRDCYEAFAISSFFALMCEYVAPGLHEQKKFFRTLTPVNWFWGVFFMQKCTGGEHRGPFRKPRSGLTWFNVIWAGIFQYCLIRVLFTIVSVVSEVFDRYCEHSLNPAFAHIWVVCFEGASVTVAMFCLVQFYIQLKQELSAHRPAMKIICIKLVIFFSFWQTMVISFAASSSGPLQPTAKLSYPDIYVGIPSVLLCIEMAFFAILHIFAFDWKPYSLKHGAAGYTSSSNAVESGAAATIPLSSRTYKGFFYAIFDAFNPWDIVKASARGLRWMFVRYKHRHTDSSYHPTAAYKAGGDQPSSTTIPEATELRPPARHQTPSNAAPGGLRVNTALEDDTAGLLSNSARPGMAHSPTTPTGHLNNHDYDAFQPGQDLGSTGRFPASPMSPADPDPWQDTSYHGSSAHPAALQPGQQGFSSSRGRAASLDGAESTGPPPSYSTHEQGQRGGWM